MKIDLAVLMTCHNRKEKTLKCLKHLLEIQILSTINKLEVFLVDDGCTDGTSQSVKEMYPQVNLIKGDGSLFWNQGMRLAWDKASSKYDYDFYLWLNDDVILNIDGIEHLFDCYNECKVRNNHVSIITGAFRDSEVGQVFSYGGRTEDGYVIPNGRLQRCKFINGNAVLVPKIIFNKLGNLSNDYTHGMGDYDYGLRALKNNFFNYTTKDYIGVCAINSEPQWFDSKIPLITRLKLFRSPKGLNYREYILFRKKFWKYKWVIFGIKAYIKVLFPGIYNRIAKKI